MRKTIIIALFALVAMVGQGQTMPQDWFKTDSITIRGRIEGYDAEKFGFTSMECYFQAKKFGRVGMIPSTCYLEYKETDS